MSPLHRNSGRTYDTKKFLEALDKVAELRGRAIGEEVLHSFQDITAPAVVEIDIREDSTVIWVNVEGATVLRCCRIGELVITDRRVSNVQPEV